ncbi:hypothetical protein SEA_COMRADE_12 [Streptomyces phage Comrade]|uniref:Uncharacterized protein n=3 Tax=Gilsonvirus comrade TaxID=2846395 RepID=A0A345MDU9_9CAUD|nr:hypothetical protein HWB84_gp012 [Streptomyces phage Comrade]AXH68730.1 hypothetical protein SEA_SPARKLEGODDESS_12 [Streptomyces phage SparkleGoddess]QQO39702.1 hypothetical protein SEA_BELFORT_14 [Streptomyces phage Belfort]QZE11612.1 hypothetical protein SEA_KARP_12 [Streptomyces phage Karp]UTN92271.1 hypothetical protein SEA_STIGMA_12 [Streptomyces phage Stigma]AXQ63496.1 hypothetical protein SEA_COMRADE_12 [Streptomyces phage Comrade]
MPNKEDKYYQDRRFWFRKFVDARDSGDSVGRKRAFKKLLELTDGKFNGTDPDK